MRVSSHRLQPLVHREIQRAVADAEERGCQAGEIPAQAFGGVDAAQTGEEGGVRAG